MDSLEPGLDGLRPGRKRPTRLDTLPTEVLDRILRHLPSTSLPDVALTCRRFAFPARRAMFAHPVLDDLLSADTFRQAFADRPESTVDLVKSLTFRWWSHWAPWLGRLQSLPLIEAVEVMNPEALWEYLYGFDGREAACQLSEVVDLVEVFSALRRQPQVTRLTVHSPSPVHGLSDEGPVPRPEQPLPGLKDLTLTSVRLLPRPHDRPYVLDGLLFACPKLTRLVIELSPDLPVGGFSNRLLSFLGYLASLEELVLDGGLAQDEDGSLPDLAPVVNRLRKVSLSFSKRRRFPFNLPVVHPNDAGPLQPNLGPVQPEVANPNAAFGAQPGLAQQIQAMLGLAPEQAPVAAPPAQLNVVPPVHPPGFPAQLAYDPSELFVGMHPSLEYISWTPLQHRYPGSDLFSSILAGQFPSLKFVELVVCDSPARVLGPRAGRSLVGFTSDAAGRSFACAAYFEERGFRVHLSSSYFSAVAPGSTSETDGGGRVELCEEGWSSGSGGYCGCR